MEGLLAGLGINWGVFISQVISFLILFGLLYLVAYKPLMRMLDERSRRIKESMDQTEQVKEQAALAEQETAKRLAEASQEGQKLVERAVQAGEEVKAKAREDAQKEAEKLLSRARSEIERERDDAIGEMRKEFADLTIMAAEKVIDRSLDKKTHRQLIDEVFEESSLAKEN
jgi:F-type H+-transporting ATPase subunit b